MSCVPPPARLPDLFVDRSLGRIVVPRLLREARLALTTLAERYGIPTDETISDEQWLADAGRLQEVVFLKDGRVRYNVAEKAAIKRHHVRCFCLSRQDLLGPEMAARFLRNLDRIIIASQEAGPFLYAVHENRIQKMEL